MITVYALIMYHVNHKNWRYIILITQLFNILYDSPNCELIRMTKKGLNGSRVRIGN